jgi:hypothetical protein
MVKNIPDPAQTEQTKQRLGLALSGGGFRASFFHLGVLARMAELGLLQHVEVISTVSGGSIIGVLYYLRLRELLMSKADAQITGQDYVDMVARIERDFLSAVQQNLRTRTFVNPLQNMKMALPHYSRSNRIGELYDRYLYRAVFGAGRDKPIEMRELKIQPKNDPHHDGFNPTLPGHNDHRFAKVPVLSINATTLNTGHNWRFLASRMGEQPHATAFADDIDKNSRLQRGEYDKIVEAQQDFPLGIAVAASAGVPLLFPPLPISGMYKDWRVQLVDGGVYDNQGIAALEDPLMRRNVASLKPSRLTVTRDRPASLSAWAFLPSNTPLVVSAISSGSPDAVCRRASFSISCSIPCLSNGSPPVKRIFRIPSRTNNPAMRSISSKLSNSVRGRNTWFSSNISRGMQ